MNRFFLLFIIGVGFISSSAFSGFDYNAGWKQKYQGVNKFDGMSKASKPKPSKKPSTL